MKLIGLQWGERKLCVLDTAEATQYLTHGVHRLQPPAPEPRTEDKQHGKEPEKTISGAPARL